MESLSKYCEADTHYLRPSHQDGVLNLRVLKLVQSTYRCVWNSTPLYLPPPLPPGGIGVKVLQTCQLCIIHYALFMQ